MKALSLWSPWSVLLCSGIKQVETREWRMHHRGRLLIHAAKHWSADILNLCRDEPFLSCLQSLGMKVPEIGQRQRGRPKLEYVDGLPLGALVGMVDVRGCWPTEQVVVTPEANAFCFGTVKPWAQRLNINERERQFGDYRPGRFATLCVNARLFPKPLPFVGRQGIFEVPLSQLPPELELS